MSFTVWFIGRPASGKSTLAKRVETRLRDGGRAVENLDGDDIRENLHPELGFSREDRATNNRRTAYICKLLNRNGISVVNAMITPFRESQRQARDIVEPDGEFVLVYVKCSLEAAKRRDPKGLYEQATAGNIENFTGVDHPFQEPHNPDIVVDTVDDGVAESVDHVIRRLEELNILEQRAADEYGVEMTSSEARTVRARLTDLGYLDLGSDSE